MENFDAFSRREYFGPNLEVFVDPPRGRLGPTCSNLLLCSQSDLSDAKQLGYFPLREKMPFVLSTKMSVFHTLLCPIYYLSRVAVHMIKLCNVRLPFPLEACAVHL